MAGTVQYGHVRGLGSTRRAVQYVSKRPHRRRSHYGAAARALHSNWHRCACRPILCVPAAAEKERASPGGKNEGTLKTKGLRKEDRPRCCAGWMLRSLGKADVQLLVDFCEEHLRHFSSEGLRYATEKLPKAQRRDFLLRRRGATQPPPE